MVNTMIYNAMPGAVIIKINAKAGITTRESGLVLVEKTDKATTTIAEIISVGDVREDLKVGMKILFPSNTGLMIAKDTYYLKYEDICATVA